MKEEKVLPKDWQVKNIQKELKSQGVDPDTVDVNALVDEKLTYNENKNAVLSQHGNLSEEQMFQESAGGQLSGDIENLKKRMVTKEDVNRLIAASMKAREAEAKKITEQTKIAAASVAQAAPSSPGSAGASPGLRQKIASLKGAAYKKFVLPRKEKKAAEQKTKLERQLVDVNKAIAERSEREIAIKAGKISGTKQAAKTFYKQQTALELQYQALQPQRSEGIRSRLVALITGYKTTTNPIVRRQLALEIAKKRNELFVQQEVDKRTFALQLAAAQRQAFRAQQIKQYKEQLQNGTIVQGQQYPQPGFNPLGPPRYVVNFNPMGQHPLLNMSASRQGVPMRPMPMRRQPRQMPVRQRQGRRIIRPNVPVMIPPHREDPNPMTGVCRYCGRKHRRFL